MLRLWNKLTGIEATDKNSIWWSSLGTNWFFLCFSSVPVGYKCELSRSWDMIWSFNMQRILKLGNLAWDFPNPSLPQYKNYMGGPPSSALSQALEPAKKHFSCCIWGFRHINRLDEQFLHNQLHRYPKNQIIASNKLSWSQIM